MNTRVRMTSRPRGWSKPLSADGHALREAAAKAL
jgi:hypothetical protein